MRVQSRGGEDPLEESTANALQYSCLENPIGRGALGATVQGSQSVGTTAAHMHTHICIYSFSNPFPI